MASRLIVRVGGLNYGPARAQNDTVDWLFCGLAVVVALVAVAPAVWRNWAAIRLALGRIYSDFRDYPEMVDIHPRHRGGREDEAASISASSRGFWRETTPDTLVPPVARLNRLLSDKLPTDEINIYPAMGDDGTPHFVTCCSNTLILLW